MGPLTKIVSGGQTGVDRAALDAALAMGLDIGGWCPKGRRAEDGEIDPSYPLQETPGETYSLRTERNVQDSDGTLILHRGQIMGGTAFTKKMALRHQRPCLCIEISSEHALPVALDWVTTSSINTLNVAGPRESAEPCIYGEAYQFLIGLLERLRVEG